MKSFRVVLLACVIAMLSCSAAFAGSGKAIMPHWLAQHNGGSNIQSSIIFISNITQHDLTVKITIYKKDGSIKTQGNAFTNFKNNNTEIGAGKTGVLDIKWENISNTSDYGYAVIEWENKNYDDDVVGLVAWGRWAETGPRGYAIEINNGQPF
ncbi:hypothetical protein D0S45_11415 [Marinifilum sp. JC120]|nr:hypothetical protein D0S45_11415 [Marinifilum sp. JC120]